MLHTGFFNCMMFILVIFGSVTLMVCAVRDLCLNVIYYLCTKILVAKTSTSSPNENYFGTEGVVWN